MPAKDEAAFQRWYADMARQYDLNPNPDGQFYDYRAAFRAGAQPDQTGHWPSQFKLPGHPAMVVGGFHVQTGERVPGTAQASESELVNLGWDPATAARMTQRPVLPASMRPAMGHAPGAGLMMGSRDKAGVDPQLVRELILKRLQE